MLLDWVFSFSEKKKYMQFMFTFCVDVYLMLMVAANHPGGAGSPICDRGPARAAGRAVPSRRALLWRLGGIRDSAGEYGEIVSGCAACGRRFRTDYDCTGMKAREINR